VNRQDAYFEGNKRPQGAEAWRLVQRGRCQCAAVHVASTSSPAGRAAQKLLGLTGFALHAAIVRLNGRSSSADFLHDDPDAVQQISGGAAMWPESFLEPGTFFRNGSLHAEAAPRLTAWAGASDCEARAVVQRARECTDHS
jgi:hypothetical protein